MTRHKKSGVVPGDVIEPRRCGRFARRSPGSSTCFRFCVHSLVLCVCMRVWVAFQELKQDQPGLFALSQEPLQERICIGCVLRRLHTAWSCIEFHTSLANPNNVAAARWLHYTQSTVRSLQAACSCGSQRGGAKLSALSCGCAWSWRHGLRYEER